ncbi:MAG: HPr family phosphocarrier protein [Glaciihabitans sp.]|nr:HPr family phosphocarrier protein [Glaciihabitans sp.]
MTVALVVVSHSAKIAEGVVDLAGQMAPDVTIVAAGGTDDAGIGTSFEKILAAIDEADGGDGVVILCDLGSAILTAETVIEFLDEDLQSRVRIVDAPVVEGAVAAAVAAQVGGEIDQVIAAARSDVVAAAAGGADRKASGEADGPPPVAAEFGSAVLVNDSGLHARPAADFVRLASTFDATIRINGVDARSLLGIMALGLNKGAEVRLEATGPDAVTAIASLTALVDSGFGE